MTIDRWGARAQIRVPQTGVVAALVVAALIAWRPAGAAGDVARKVAEFREGADFVVGGLDFTGDGTELATNGQWPLPRYTSGVGRRRVISLEFSNCLRVQVGVRRFALARTALCSRSATDLIFSTPSFESGEPIRGR